MDRRRYLKARCHLALTSLAMIALGWIVGGYSIHGPHAQKLYIIGWIATFIVVPAGPLLLIVGNVLLWLRYRKDSQVQRLASETQQAKQA